MSAPRAVDQGAEVRSEDEPERPEVAVKGPAGRCTFRLTVELPFFFTFFSLALSGAVVNNLLLQRSCLHSLGYNQSVCSDLVTPNNNRSDEMRHLEDEAQTVTTLVTMVKSMVEGVFPALLSLFLGVWSNTHGRKPLIVWPLIGAAFSSMMVCAYSLLGALGPWWYVATSLPYSLSGGFSALFTGAFCYISDVSDVDARSFRIALMEAALMGGLILGSLASPYAAAALGTPCLLLLTSALSVVSYVYTELWVDESVEGAVAGDLHSIFDMSFVRDMLRVCFKRRPHYDRAVLLLLVVANSTSIFILYGLANVDYLYTREKLSWGLQEYSVFSAVNMVVTVAGLLLGVGLLQRRWRLSDSVMSMVAFVSSMIDMLLRALATAATAWLMYLGSSLSLLRGLSSPLIRSLISKREAPVDVAKVFALMAALEAVLPVLSPLVYNLLYRYTLTVLPGAVYYMTMGIYGACLAMTCAAHYLMMKYPIQQYSVLES